MIETNREMRTKARCVRLLAAVVVLLGTMPAAYAWKATGWNYLETTKLGYMTQGGTITKSSIVLNWRNNDSTASKQSFYVTIPPNSIMDIEVRCEASTGCLYTEVVPNTLGFISSLSLPAGWAKIGSVRSGSSWTEFQIHMHFETTSTCATYAHLKLSCRSNGNSSSSSSSTSTASGKKVTFNANGGTGGTTRYVASGKAVGTLPKPTRTGYRFKGWYTKKSGGSKISAKTKIKKSVTYYAHWAANKYKIKFNANGGKGKMSTLSATYGKTVTLRANAFKKSGRKFWGWSKTKGGSVVYKNKAKVKNLTSGNGKTVTLYAVWDNTGSSSSTGSSTTGGSTTGGSTGTTYTGSTTSSNAAMREFWMSEYRKWSAKAEEQAKQVQFCQEQLDWNISHGYSYATASLSLQAAKELYNTYVTNANNAYREAMKY